MDFFNIGYIYGLVYSALLVLYSFALSDLCVKLDLGLFIFLIASIIISFVLGYVFRKVYRFVDVVVSRELINKKLIWGIVASCLFEYVYCGQIPIIAIINGASSYTSFTGIHTFHTFICTLASFYAQYLLYLFICNKKNYKCFFYYCLILFVAFFLQFNRGQLLVNLFISVAMIIQSLKGKIKVRHIILVLISFVGILYVFGGLGNIRHGFAWDDNRYITILGQYNSKWPSWLPGQFKWTYSYLISPISNLNHNIVHKGASINAMGIITTYFPDFVANRLPQSTSNLLLVVPWFTTLPGYAGAFCFGGSYIGLVIYFTVLVILPTMILVAAPFKPEYRTIVNAVMSTIVAFSFFTNTITYSAISFILLYPFLSLLNTPKIVLKNRTKPNVKAGCK